MKRLTKDKYVRELDPKATPAITIVSGEELIVETWDAFEGVRDASTLGKTLKPPATGPIYVEGAMPGDALKIDFISVKAVKDAAQYSTSEIGILGEEYPDTRLTAMPIEGDYLIFPGGIKLPLRPDVGVVATTPTYVQRPYGSIGPYGGDIDIHELGEGSTLYLPVFVEGGLLVMADGHAVAGEGTMAGSAAETSLELHVRVTVEKGLNLKSPRALTPEHFIIQAHAENDGDLAECVRQAVREMVEFLVQEKGMKPEDAYSLLSLAGDVVGPPSSRNLYMASPKVMLSRHVFDQL